MNLEVLDNGYTSEIRPKLKRLGYTEISRFFRIPRGLLTLTTQEPRM
jgi:hypothetical protein